MKTKPGYKKREERIGWIFANIPFFGFAIFGLIPLILSVFLSFNHFKGLRLNSATFVGFDNFKTIFEDELFWQSINNTLFVVVATIISLILSIIISALLATEVKGSKGFKVIYFVPYVCSLVAITFMWKWIYDYNYGVLNATLIEWGLIKEKINWLGSEEYFRTAMMILLIWSSMGFNIILLTASLTSIDRNLYEASSIDGANGIRQFFTITLPMVSPTIFYLLITGLIGSLQSFTIFQVMAKDGGPGQKGLTVVFYLYKKLFNASGGSDLGVASAIGWIVALLIAIVTIINFIGQKKWVNYD
ncbi:MAG: sugar ABC transporter permease [Erysipelotrichaceae bacterium]|nr:sugar ABC transporter permease [Erysipelotrichaceae bacterium]